MMAAEVPDTSVFIRFIRGEDWSGMVAYCSSRQVWLSSVVLTELYAGSRDSESPWVRAMERLMRKEHRLLTPTHEDWATVGHLINRFVRLHGGPREPREHLQDALIVVSASRLHGGVVRTHNLSHMEMWAAMARQANHSVTVALAP